MPKSHQYFTGSLLYARGDEASKIFILKSGKVSMATLDAETGAEVRELVSPGEFFGVKSALGHFPREENAVAVADSSAMVFTVAEFEAFAMSNPNIIIKMLKVFSNQMRRVHAQIAKLMASEVEKPDEGLFSIGEKYLKQKRYEHAKYIFERYLVHYPSGARAAQAEKNLQLVNKGAASSAAKTQLKGIASDYRNAMGLISSQKYEDAIQIFEKIIETCNEPEWVYKSEYSTGHCLFLLEKFDDCIKHFMAMLKKNPDHPDAKEAMFYMGEASERLGNKAQAAAWYNKILSMPDLEAGGMRARAKQALKDLGA
jgi:CRP-like cAMP-binding protein